MKWFDNPKTVEDLKKQYKKLALKHHPDCGGNVREMQEINGEYDFLFQRLKNTHETASGETYEAKEETAETPEEFRDVIEALINLNGIEIEICGSWVWVTGNTFEHREKLKSLNFHFSSNKKAWYYHSDGSRKKSRKTFSMEEIRDLFGSETVKTNKIYELQKA